MNHSHKSACYDMYMHVIYIYMYVLVAWSLVGISYAYVLLWVKWHKQHPKFSHTILGFWFRVPSGWKFSRYHSCYLIPAVNMLSVHLYYSYRCGDVSISDLGEGEEQHDRHQHWWRCTNVPRALCRPGTCTRTRMFQYTPCSCMFCYNFSVTVRVLVCF